MFTVGSLPDVINTHGFTCTSLSDVNIYTHDTAQSLTTASILSTHYITGCKKTEIHAAIVHTHTHTHAVYL